MTAKRRRATAPSPTSEPFPRPPSATTPRQHGTLKLDVHVNPCPHCYVLLNDLSTAQMNAGQFEAEFNDHLKATQHQLRFT